jgi:calcineurin-like phosphoesterase
MVGGYDSVIGIKKEQALLRFLTSRSQRFEPSKERSVLAAVFIEIEAKTGRALSIQRRLVIGDGCGE